MTDIKGTVKGIYEKLDEKKGEDIRIIDISGLSDIADYFVIATANNPNQMDALQDTVDEFMTEQNVSIRNTEGHVRDHSSWILMDYGDIIVHIFDREAREFYNLEHLWKGGRVEVTEL
ncbi:MAG: ribosome silencing factor [Lachnospiraceae bacterium]|nr:ribosome silencing factor [Lachnospiraceae bacterium]